MLSSAISLFSRDPFPPWWDLVRICIRRSLPHFDAPLGKIRYACVFFFGHFGAPQSAPPWRECVYLVVVIMFCVFFIYRYFERRFQVRIDWAFLYTGFVVFLQEEACLCRYYFTYCSPSSDRVRESRQGRIADVRIFACLHYSRFHYIWINSF